MYTFENNRGHIDIYRDGEFVGSADNMTEAEAEVREMSEPVAV